MHRESGSMEPGWFYWISRWYRCISQRWNWIAGESNNTSTIWAVRVMMGRSRPRTCSMVKRAASAIPMGRGGSLSVSWGPVRWW